jgi:hypothetical protein
MVKRMRWVGAVGLVDCGGFGDGGEAGIVPG